MDAKHLGGNGRYHNNGPLAAGPDGAKAVKRDFTAPKSTISSNFPNYGAISRAPGKTRNIAKLIPGTHSIMKCEVADSSRRQKAVVASKISPESVHLSIFTLWTTPGLDAGMDPTRVWCSSDFLCRGDPLRIPHKASHPPSIPLCIVRPRQVKLNRRAANSIAEPTTITQQLKPVLSFFNRFLRIAWPACLPKDTWEDSRDAIGVFYDLPKTFDCVHHNTLIRKLHHYGVTVRLLALLEFYLRGRMQRVDVNGERSSESTVNMGIP
ncbi:hypothetical protein EVAR_95457_1 [Eumeta japonica]|uniref:RNA-directed DNA polymerase from transposon BS n=1 Tax=Eumeta variegata TaxID=151549 RepID=A0A4C1UIY7_EUMVA|nr:hypothetical protein EVAR_95457_1 [Eumeta japonica]